MQICKNIETKNVFILVKEAKDDRAYFIAPDGSIDLLEKEKFEGYLEETDELYLRDYLIITDDQYRHYRSFAEAEMEKLFNLKGTERI
jgi:hypothetical protein